MHFASAHVDDRTCCHVTNVIRIQGRGHAWRLGNSLSLTYLILAD